MNARRACPYCRELINAGARRCPNCGARLPALWNAGGPDWLRHLRLRNFAIVALVFLFAVCALQVK